MKKIRLGVIGCGGIMEKVHIDGLIADKDALEVTAVCDIVLEKAQKASEALGGTAKVYTNYKDMVDDVDAVSIALPHDLHYEVGMFFAAKGIHILMEKPICNHEEECNRLIKLSEEKGITFMCEYPKRYQPSMIKLKEIIDSGEYGKPYHMSVWTEQYTDDRSASWLSTARLGGGQLFSHGCHYTDLLLWFLGEPLEGSHMGTNFGTPWMIQEGTSTLGLKFKSGATAMHFATWGAKGTKMGYDYQVFMDSGKVLNYDEKTQEIRLYYNEKRWEAEKEDTYNLEDLVDDYRVIWNGNDETTAQKGLNRVYQEFVECINTGRESFTSGRRALESLRLIWKVYDAEKAHKVADLSDIKAYQ